MIRVLLMYAKKIGFSLLGATFAVVLAGCASTGDSTSPVPPQASATPTCRSTEPTTGTSIRRRDCGSAEVQTVNNDNLREYKREAGTK